LFGHGGVIDQQARSFDARFHVGQFEGDALELADLLPEGFALARIGKRGFVRGFGNAQRLRADADAAHVQHGHGNLETLAFLPEPVFDRDAAVFEHDFAGGGGADAQLGLFLARLYPGVSASTRKAVMPFCFFSGSVIMNTTTYIGHRPARDPGLASV
jgi:hypothetical protein